MSDTYDNRSSESATQLDAKLQQPRSEIVMTYEERVAADRRDARRAAKEAILQLAGAHDLLNRAAPSRMEEHRASRV